MDFFVVFLESRRYMVVQRQWISNPVVGAEAKIFFSADKNAVPNFEIEPEFYVNPNLGACYNAFVLKAFGKPNSFSKCITFLLKHSNHYRQRIGSKSICINKAR